LLSFFWKEEYIEERLIEQGCRYVSIGELLGMDINFCNISSKAIQDLFEEKDRSMVKDMLEQFRRLTTSGAMLDRFSEDADSRRVWKDGLPKMMRAYYEDHNILRSVQINFYVGRFGYIADIMKDSPQKDEIS